MSATTRGGSLGVVESSTVGAEHLPSPSSRTGALPPAALPSSREAVS
jgi:hypothetical protein